MRSKIILNYESILQVLDETGCPFCRFMKNFQATRLQNQEDRRIREFIGCAHHKLVAQWMRSLAVLCIIHGTKLKNSASPVLTSAIGSIVEKHRENLIEEFTHLRDEYQPDTASWGCWDMQQDFWFHNAGCIHK